MRTKTRFAGYLGAALAAVMLGAIVQPAAALEISRHEAKDNAEINAILLKGKIDLGDTFDLQVYIASLPKKPSIVVYLNSPGGNLAEGMRLGRFFYQNKIETVVESKTACTSACALAFLGGRDNGSGKPRRTKFSTAGLGFHSFSREFDENSQLYRRRSQGHRARNAGSGVRRGRIPSLDRHGSGCAASHVARGGEPDELPVERRRHRSQYPRMG